MTNNSFVVRRAFAALIDNIIFLAILLIYNFLRGNAPEWEGNLFAYIFRSIPGFFIVLFIWFFYYPVLESMLGYTLGKGLFDLEVVLENKKDSPLGVSLKRHLLDPIDYFIFGVPAILLVTFSEDHKRLGDRWANSRVLREGEKIPVPSIIDYSALNIPKVEYGGFWLRLGANIVDAVVLIPFALLSIYVMLFGNPFVLVIIEIITSMSMVAYVTVMHAKYGATLGKMAVGLRVRKLDFSTIGWDEAIKRSSVDYFLVFLATLGRIVTLLSIPVQEIRNASIWDFTNLISTHESQIAGLAQSLYNLWFWGEVITLLFNKKKRALHDLIAGTVVVEKDSLLAIYKKDSSMAA
jgi:uncharacterized RDD family membrane protein YckC